MCFKKGAGGDMNAQEAIEILEKRLSYLKEYVDYTMKNQAIYSEKFYRTLKEIEALSIILESAKKLQEIKDKALSYAFIKDIDCNNVDLYDFAKWVYDKAEGFEVEK